MPEAVRPLVADGSERRRQRVQRRQRDPGVRVLVSSLQAERPGGRGARVHQDHRVGPAALGFRDEHLANGGIRLPRHERNVALRDAGLLPRDRREVRPQVVGVLPRDFGDHRHERRDDVGRVEPPSQSDFDHGDVHPPRREVGESDRGRGLEETRVESLDVGAQERGPFGEGLLADRHPVHLHALSHRDEMRRRVQPDLEPPGAQLGRGERASRALAVGARHMDRGEVPLRMAQHVQEPLGRPEAPLDTAPLSREEIAAGVLEGQPGQSAASAGCRPAM